MKPITAYEVIVRFSEKFPEIRRRMEIITHSFEDNGEVNPYHAEGSIWTHTMMVMKEADEFVSNSAKATLLLTALCHDIGKCYTAEDVKGDPDGKYDVQKMDRRRFKNHEAVSVFYAKEVLNAFDDYELSNFRKELILKTIANHGSLYNYIEDGRIPKKHFMTIAKKYSSKEFIAMRNFYICDHDGRFYKEESGGKYNRIYQDFNDIIDIIDITEAKEANEVSSRETEIVKTLTLLVGTPASGKSTWISNNLKDEVLISRDETMMDYAKDQHITGDYSTVWSKMTIEDQNNVDELLLQKFNDAKSQNKDIIIDMTNMNKKARNKWTKNSRGYFKKAIVFIEHPDEIKRRNKVRTEQEGKDIPGHVIDRFMKSFSYPDYSEFDEISMYWPEIKGE